MSAKAIHVLVNPESRNANILDPDFRNEWDQSLEEIRDEEEVKLLAALHDGSLEVTPVPGSVFDTPEKVIHLQADRIAVTALERMFVYGAVGLPGDSGYYHGQDIIYHDDPAVPLFGHVIIEDPAA